MARNNIVIITCWYGPYPWYFSYFVHSCSFNPSVNFVIVTDNNETINNQPVNLKIYKKSIHQIIQGATDSLGFAVNIGYPYKLTDFKPAYGLLFPELVEGYDFWGHADLDIVYGDIRGFITDEILYNHDVISSRHDYITGSFCLYRNNHQMNTLFTKSRDYKKVFTSNEHYCFDECNFLFQELQNGASIFDYPDNIQSMTYVVQKAALDGKLRAFFDFIIIEGTPGKINWAAGKIIYKEKYEAMFYHLIKFKTDCKKPVALAPNTSAIRFNPKTIRITTAN